MSDLQREFDEALDKISKQYEKENEKQVEETVTAIMLIRLFLLDLINDYQKDGVIKRGRLNALLRDLDYYEKEFRKQAGASFEKMINDTSKWTTSKLAETSLGIKTIDSVNTNVVQYMLKRKGADFLVLSDRIWNLAGDMRAELAKVIRPAVLKGESVSSISQKIREVHDNEKWKIERVAITESNNTHRAATIYNGEESDIVTGYKIIDNGHRHRYHSKHTCYKLARRDAYGLGPGRYPKKIPESLMAQLISPHPQCSSRLNYIIGEEE
ncbi:hypothetical protein [Bacillus wiedmannii]|uniref:hypothetical protein n=1 Tax=Bacillus wiedmannii TaxID=1890302 RepID=UPI000BF78480|nr:hypothetical protein [Bacillus wiedmannii]PGA33982.1 hypothetical protein COL74_12080 [Bacillus wiedmannii]